MPDLSPKSLTQIINRTFNFPVPVKLAYVHKYSNKPLKGFFDLKPYIK
jgi:hypothetical protein